MPRGWSQVDLSPSTFAFHRERSPEGFLICKMKPKESLFRVVRGLNTMEYLKDFVISNVLPPGELPCILCEPFPNPTEAQ